MHRCARRGTALARPVLLRHGSVLCGRAAARLLPWSRRWLPRCVRACRGRPGHGALGRMLARQFLTGSGARTDVRVRRGCEVVQHARRVGRRVLGLVPTRGNPRLHRQHDRLGEGGHRRDDRCTGGAAAALRGVRGHTVGSGHREHRNHRLCREERAAGRRCAGGQKARTALKRQETSGGWGLGTAALGFISAPSPPAPRRPHRRGAGGNAAQIEYIERVAAARPVVEHGGEGGASDV